MPERRFLSTEGLQGYALYQIPYHRQFLIECRSCGVQKEMSRDHLEQANERLSLTEMAPRFRCALCGEKTAVIMAGSWETIECRDGSSTRS